MVRVKEVDKKLVDLARTWSGGLLGKWVTYQPTGAGLGRGGQHTEGQEEAAHCTGEETEAAGDRLRVAQCKAESCRLVCSWQPVSRAAASPTSTLPGLEALKFPLPLYPFLLGPTCPLCPGGWSLPHPDSLGTNVIVDGSIFSAPPSQDCGCL